MVSAKVNDKYVEDLGYVLKNNDRVVVFTDELSSGPKIDWLGKVVTSRAKEKIKKYSMIGNNS